VGQYEQKHADGQDDKGRRKKQLVESHTGDTTNNKQDKGEDDRQYGYLPLFQQLSLRPTGKATTDAPGNLVILPIENTILLVEGQNGPASFHQKNNSRELKKQNRRIRLAQLQDVDNSFPIDKQEQKTERRGRNNVSPLEEHPERSPKD